ncbi:MAG: hypothetical protein JXA03_02640, partial [Bacteroidales bacterium]|nr:hypothetical protein [Bacteroidales bacterium]
VPIGFSCGAGGGYSLSLSECTVGDDLRILLEDLKTGRMHSFGSDGVYHFSYQADENPDRLMLHFMPKENLLQIWTWENTLYIANPGMREGLVSIYNLLGCEIDNRSLLPDLNRIAITQKGYYVVVVQTQEGVSSGKVWVH